MSTKRLLFVCQHFEPETFRGNDIVRDMVSRGVEVTVITGIPNYPKGKFYDGYGLFRRRREMVDGIRVIRVPIVPRGTGNKIQLLLNYFSYFISASLFLPFHLLTARKYDACFVQQLSPVMMSVPGVVFKLLTRRPLYTWVLDLWPESLKAAGGINNRRVLDLFGWFAKLQYRHSDIIFVSSKGFERNITAKGDYGSKIDLLPNWAEDDITTGAADKPIPQLPDPFTVMFTGNVGEAQDFDSIVETARLLTHDDRIQIVVVGDGRKKAEVDAIIAREGLGDRLIMLGRYDISYMPSFYNRADALLLSLKDSEIFNLTVPAKLQAYMAAGKPIVAMINGDAAEVINEAHCGVAVNASSPAALVDAMRKLKGMPADQLSAMGQRGKEYCKENYDKTKVLNKLYNTIFPDK